MAKGAQQLQREAAAAAKVGHLAPCSCELLAYCVVPNRMQRQPVSSGNGCDALQREKRNTSKADGPPNGSPPPALPACTSRMAVMGKPSFSLSILIFLAATFSRVRRSVARYTCSQARVGAREASLHAAAGAEEAAAMGETLSSSSLCLGTRLLSAATQLLKLKTSVQAQRGRSGGGNGGGAPRRTCPGPARCLCGTPTRCCGSPQTRRRAWRPTRAAPGATRWGWTRTCPGRLLAAWWGAAAPGTPSWRPAGAPGDCAVLRRSLERLGGCLLAFSSGGDQRGGAQ